MSVDKPKSSYDEYKAIWSKCRDAALGQEEVHAKGREYLPSLSGQTETEYLAYKNRAVFYNATARTIDALSGLLFRKDPRVELPDSLRPILYNIDSKGSYLTDLVEYIAEEIFIVGRIGLLVDYPRVDVEMTVAEAERANLTPFMTTYTAENIINWTTRVINNKIRLSMVVLREITEHVDPVTFKDTTCTKYRVLSLDEAGLYNQMTYKHDSASNCYIPELGEPLYPLMSGNRMNYIPFIIVGSRTISEEIQKPPLLDLINLNFSHYRSTADIEHAAHYTALPTPVIVGHSLAEGTTLKIGSSEAWVFSEPDANAFYLEYSGQGLGALEERIDKKESQMAALGARMLMGDKAAAETAETHQIKRQGEYSALASLAQSISNAITVILSWIAEWKGLDSTDILYQINKDFFPSQLSAQELTALLQTWQSGGIAFSDFINQLKKGEIIEGDRSPEDIKDELDLEGIVVGSSPNNLDTV